MNRKEGDDDVTALKREIEELRAQNDAFVQELVGARKRHKSLDEHSKRIKLDSSATSDLNETALSVPTESSDKETTVRESDYLSGKTSSAIAVSGCQFPSEVLLCIFRHVTRQDLDQFQLVCKKWKNLIAENNMKLPLKLIHCLKIIEKNHISLTVSTKSNTKHYVFSLTDHERSDVLFDSLKSLLKNTIVRRWIMCNISITDNFCRRLSHCIKELHLPEVLRVEMLSINIQRVSPDVFHKFLGQTVVASQYFLDGVRNATEEHFSSKLFEQQAIQRADDFTVYDVRTIENDDVLLNVGDDSLLAFIFGNEHGTPRNTLYLDGPHISPGFLKACLLQFVETENADKVIAHVEFAHCHEQHVPTMRNITLEYEHDIQVEWSAKNKKTGRVMEARVSRNGDDDNFCHLTLSVQSE